MTIFKKYRVTIIMTVLLCLVPIAFGLALWDRLPEMMPTHFNIQNEADGFMKKEMAVFLLPGFIAAIELFCVAATALDPKGANISGKALLPVLWAMTFMSWICSAVSYCTAMGYKMNIGSILVTFMGFLFVAIGNYLPKNGQNFSIGVRTAWALSDAGNWNYTNRFAAICFSVCGIITALLGIASFFMQDAAALYIISMALIIGCAFVPIIASFVYYRKHPPVEAGEGDAGEQPEE